MHRVYSEDLFTWNFLKTPLVWANRFDSYSSLHSLKRKNLTRNSRNETLQWRARKMITCTVIFGMPFCLTQSVEWFCKRFWATPRYMSSPRCVSEVNDDTRVRSPPVFSRPCIWQQSCIPPSYKTYPLHADPFHVRGIGPMQRVNPYKRTGHDIFVMFSHHFSNENLNDCQCSQYEDRF